MLVAMAFTDPKQYTALSVVKEFGLEDCVMCFSLFQFLHVSLIGFIGRIIPAFVGICPSRARILRLSDTRGVNWPRHLHLKLWYYLRQRLMRTPSVDGYVEFQAII